MVRRDFLAAAAVLLAGILPRPRCVACSEARHVCPVVDRKGVQISWACGLCVMAVLVPGHEHQLAVQKAVDDGTCRQTPVSHELLPYLTRQR
jgi:hypothetical protein